MSIALVILVSSLVEVFVASYDISSFPILIYPLFAAPTGDPSNVVNIPTLSTLITVVSESIFSCNRLPF